MENNVVNVSIDVLEPAEMEEKDIYKVKTTCGTLQYWLDWDCDGAIRMENPQTIKRYNELRYHSHPDCKEHHCFFAFTVKDVTDGYAELVKEGVVKEGEKIVQGKHGLFGTKEGIKSFYAAYDALDEKIKSECDPQEVYFYEYNNHEAMINWDGDEDAIEIIISLWGLETAKKIKRYNAYKEI